MAKPTFYEVLGIPPDADEAQIHEAYARALAQVAAGVEGAELRSRRLFIAHAYKVLSDKAARAEYDLQLQSALRPAIGQAPALRSRTPWRRTLLLLVAAAGTLVWVSWDRHFGADALPPSDSQMILEMPPVASDDGANEAQSLEPAADETPQGPPAAAMTQAVPQYAISVSSPDGELVKKLVWSVYGIVGKAGLGTGIMIEGDRLLTNCHVLARNVGLGPIHAVNAVTKDHAEITEAAWLPNEDACLVHAPGLSGQAVVSGTSGTLYGGASLHNIGYAEGRLSASQGQFLSRMSRFGQTFIVSSNYCAPGVSGGPLVDAGGRLVGLTTGGPANRSVCYSLTVETARLLLYQSLRPIAELPVAYVSNVTRRSW